MELQGKKDWDKIAQGKYGHDWIANGDTPIEGVVYGVLEMHGETVLSYKNNPENGKGVRVENARTIGDGKRLYGDFSDVTVTSGLVLAYREEYEIIGNRS